MLSKIVANIVVITEILQHSPTIIVPCVVVTHVIHNNSVETMLLVLRCLWDKNGKIKSQSQS